MQKALTQCRACGAEIFFIKTASFKTVPVNADPVYVHQQSGGKPYIRIDGSTVIGFIAGDAVHVLNSSKSQTVKSPRVSGLVIVSTPTGGNIVSSIGSSRPGPTVKL